MHSIYVKMSLVSLIRASYDAQLPKKTSHSASLHREVSLVRKESWRLLTVAPRTRGRLRGRKMLAVDKALSESSSDRFRLSLSFWTSEGGLT